jgi:hypothetical protein
LLELTWDEPSAVRSEAIKQLATVVSEPRVRERILALTYDEDSSVRVGAAKAVKRAAAESKVQARLLEMTKNEGLRECAEVIPALAEIANEPQVRERLLKLTRCKRVRRSKARARVSDNGKWRKLMYKGIRRNHWKVRTAAVEALEGALGHPSVQSRLTALTWRLVWDWDFLMQVFFLALVIGSAVQWLPHVLNWLPFHLHAYLVNSTIAFIAGLRAHEPTLTNVVLWTCRSALIVGTWTLRCMEVAIVPIVLMLIIRVLGSILGWEYGNAEREEVAEAALKVLRNWRGPVPRTVLWRAAYLAFVRRTEDRIQTLQALLEMRERV